MKNFTFVNIVVLLSLSNCSGNQEYDGFNLKQGNADLTSENFNPNVSSWSNASISFFKDTQNTSSDTATVYVSVLPENETSGPLQISCDFTVIRSTDQDEWQISLSNSDSTCLFQNSALGWDEKYSPICKTNLKELSGFLRWENNAVSLSITGQANLLRNEDSNMLVCASHPLYDKESPTEFLVSGVSTGFNL